jgi:exodeoxyribonuclease VII large subunit
MRECIVGYVQQRMESEKNRLTRVSERIPILFSLVRERQNAKLDRMLNEIISSVKEQLSQAQHHVAILSNNIEPLVERKLLKEQNRLEQLRLRAEALDPQLLLKRGYSITLLNGKAVHDPAELHEGDKIETRVEKGTFESIIHKA